MTTNLEISLSSHLDLKQYSNIPYLFLHSAYGGVFIISAVLWGWGVDKKGPDAYDWIGAAICIVGVSVMLWAPRH